MSADTTKKRAFYLFYSLKVSQDGVGVLDVAMNIVNKDGWAGFGFPTESGIMKDGSAIIASPCPDCPTSERAYPFFIPHARFNASMQPLTAQ